MANRRVDQLITTLLKMEADQLMDVQKKGLWPTRGATQKERTTSHQNGLLIPDHHITEVHCILNY